MPETKTPESDGKASRPGPPEPSPSCPGLPGPRFSGILAPQSLSPLCPSDSQSLFPSIRSRLVQGHSVPAASLDLHRESEGSRRNKTVPWLDGTGQEWVSQPPSRALVGRGGPGPASCILAKVKPQNGERRVTGRSDFPPPTSPGDRTEGVSNGGKAGGPVYGRGLPT